MDDSTLTFTEAMENFFIATSALALSPLVVWLLMAAFFSGVLWLMKR